MLGMDLVMPDWLLLQITMMEGALKLKHTLVKDIAIPLNEAKMLPVETELGIETMAMIHNWGFSVIISHRLLYSLFRFWSGTQ